MSNKDFEQGPRPDPDEVGSLIFNAERMLQDEGTQRLVRQRDLIDKLKPGASFAREVTSALQFQFHCFDQGTLDEILASSDLEIHMWPVAEIAERVVNEENLSDHEVLGGLMSGLAGLIDTLGSENARDKRYNQGLLDLAAVDYNSTVICLTHFFSEEEEERFSSLKHGLDLHIAPLALGILDFDEEGWAIAPGQQDTLANRLQISVNEMHDEHIAKLKEALPIHDNQSRFITAIMISIDGMVKSTGTFRKENSNSGEDWSEFYDEVIYDSQIQGLLRFYRERQYHDMSPENEEQVATIIKQYAKAIIAAYDQLGIELPNIAQA